MCHLLKLYICPLLSWPPSSSFFWPISPLLFTPHFLKKPNSTQLHSDLHIPHTVHPSLLCYSSHPHFCCLFHRLLLLFTQPTFHFHTLAWAPPWYYTLAALSSSSNPFACFSNSSSASNLRIPNTIQHLYATYLHIYYIYLLIPASTVYAILYRLKILTQKTAYSTRVLVRVELYSYEQGMYNFLLYNLIINECNTNLQG